LEDQEGDGEELYDGFWITYLPVFKTKKKIHFEDWIKILIFAYWAQVGQRGTDRVPNTVL